MIDGSTLVEIVEPGRDLVELPALGLPYDAMASAARNDFDRRDRFARASRRCLVCTSMRTERVVVMIQNLHSM